MEKYNTSMPHGGIDTLLTHLYCEHKGEWVKMTYPRAAQAGQSFARGPGKRLGVKVEVTHRGDINHEDGSAVYQGAMRMGHLWVKVSDPE